jgi:leucyl aminopeptidase
VLDINVSAIGDRAVPIALATGGLAGTRSSRFGAALALPIRTDDEGAGVLVSTGWPLAEPVAAEIAEFLVDVDHRGTAGTAHILARPTRDPGHLLLVGIGDGDAGGWRDAGAAVAATASERLTAVTVVMPDDPSGAAAREFALGAWLASYQFRIGGAGLSHALGRGRASGSRPGSEPATRRKLRRITLAHASTDTVDTLRAGVAEARAIADAVVLARDLTNTPSLQKSPRWFADRLSKAAARRKGVSVTVHDEAALASSGFGGLLAVGNGSARPPRLVELSWRPRGARAHVVLVGKGICFDSGGVSIKPLEAMKLMRKDMGGAAAVCAAVLGAADLELPVRVTALAPLAENMVSGSSMRPGDVIRHYGGATTEVLDTDAEGRLVLADALAYGARRHKPDFLVDLATLTGAQHVALGKRTAALFSDNRGLAEALQAAGDESGEPVWPLPMPDDYLGLLRSDVADLANIGQPAQAGAVVAALFLREFAGDRRDRWAHIDMSSPSWIDRNDGPLVKGATGWGVRILLRWLQTL